MKTFITSDLHFGHANIQKFCPNTRGRFVDVEHMNETMIKEWNEQVSAGDTVYILGDVAFMSAEKAVVIMQRLNGNKILIEGNHDVKLLNNPAFRSCFTEVHKYLRVVYKDTLLVMFHYPIWEWDQMYRGAVHFYGHIHGKKTGLEKFRCRDVAFDATGRVVSELDEMIADAKQGEIKSHNWIA